MEKTYTQGEWYLQDFTDAYTNIVRCNKGKGHETYYICATAQNISPETRANARLIAAAPDLLEALIDCAESFSGFTNAENETLQNARKAIAKALNHD